MKLETATSAFKKTLTSTTSAMVLALAGVTAMTAAPAEAIPFRDDVGDSGAQAFAAGWDGVVQIFYWDQGSGGIFFNCTGSMINARTVITAAHCFNSQPDSTAPRWLRDSSSDLRSQDLGQHRVRTPSV